MSILTAGLLYIVLRPDSLFGGLPELFTVNADIPGWMKYTLPDALWYVALLSFMRPVTLKKSIPCPFLTVIALLSGPLHEFLQLAHIAHGTYCPYDMLAYIFILIIYITICLNVESRQSKNT